MTRRRRPCKPDIAATQLLGTVRLTADRAGPLLGPRSWSGPDLFFRPRHDSAGVWGAACRERRDCPRGRRPDSRCFIVLEVSHRAESIVNPVSRDDLGRHFPYSPCVVGCGLDDRGCGSVVPGVQEAAGRPDTRPVAVLATFMAAEHVLRWRSAQRQDQAVIYFLALQQGDTSSDQSWPSSPPALSIDPLTRRHPVTACHGQCVSRLDSKSSAYMVRPSCRALSLTRTFHAFPSASVGPLPAPWWSPVVVSLRRRQLRDLVLRRCRTVVRDGLSPARTARGGPTWDYGVRPRGVGCGCQRRWPTT